MAFIDENKINSEIMRLAGGRIALVVVAAFLLGAFIF